MISSNRRRKVSVSGSTFDGSMITSDYQKYGNYWQRDDVRAILNEFKSKLNCQIRHLKEFLILDVGLVMSQMIYYFVWSKSMPIISALLEVILMLKQSHKQEQLTLAFQINAMGMYITSGPRSLSIP